MNDDVLSQADALMRRHRSFIAQAPGSEGIPAASPPAEEEDIPLLTDIVAARDPGAPPSLDALLDQLRGDIEVALSGWLIDALPAAVANASQHILNELDAKARHALLPQIQALIEQYRAHDR